MVPSVQHLYQELLSVLHTVLHIRICPSKVLQVQNRLSLDASSFRTKHVLTGCDITSKFGTKAVGIKAEPVLYLKDFRRAHTDVQNCVQNAEKFLVQVLNRWKHGIETMDRLRFNWYHHIKSMTITDRPAISYATKGHIQRAFYATYMQVNCLGDFSLNHGVAAILAAILEFTITRYFFHPENDFNGFPTPKT